MKLHHLLNGLNVLERHGKGDLEIKGLTSDSRAVKEGYLFVAVRGSRQDGHRYLAQAVQKGAHVLAVENIEGISGDVAVIRLPDTRAALSEMAARFYNYPAKGINLIGITGTNGKTTTSYLLESILKEAGREVGVIGTINYRFRDKSFSSSLTTPEITDLMRIIKDMRDAGVTDVIIEVSSHSLDQGRTKGLNWSRALFTNFSRDHLDYHPSMEEYFKAKSRLFYSLGEGLDKNGVKAAINMDDPKGKVLEKITKVSVVGYGLGENCLIRAADMDIRPNGSTFRLVTPEGDTTVTSPLLGKLNVYNALGAAAIAFSLNIDLDIISRGIKRVNRVPGRLQPVKNSRGLSLFVDYAHTPDALEKVLQTLQPLTKERLITVFGCGGNRDRGKRPEMGRIAGMYSDLVIITSDNPRNEDPAAIVNDIEPGVQEAGLRKLESGILCQEKSYKIVLNRREAIRDSVNMAKKEDTVLIAGKGHENYQIIGDKKIHFDDAEEVAAAAS